MRKNKIKIAFITPLMIIGGAETYLINKCEWLIANGFDVVVISEGGENVKNLPEGCLHVKLKGISLSPLMFTKKEYDLFLNRFGKILLDNKVDVIEANNSYPVVHTAAIYKVTKIPFLINILSELAYGRNPLLTILTKKFDRFNLFYLLTPDMNQYIEGVINFKLNPNIIPIPVKSISDDDCLDESYILSVSRLSDDKAYVEHLMRDFYQLYIDNRLLLSKYKLIIVGDGPRYEMLSELASYLNGKAKKEIIQFKGTLVGRALENIYKKCTLFVGMGTTLLLAASCAKPALIAGFTPETNKFSWGFWGENDLDARIIAIGSLNVRTHSSFQTGIMDIVKSDTRRINAGNAANKMFKENYDYDSIMTIWIAEYFKVISVFELSGCQIENSLRYYHLWILLYRKVRTVVKSLRI